MSGGDEIVAKVADGQMGERPEWMAPILVRETGGP